MPLKNKMAKALERLAEETPSLEEFEERGMPHRDNNAALAPEVLNDFVGSIRDRRRREEIRAEVERVFLDYMNAFRKYAPAPRRAAILEQSYNLVPTEEESEGKDAREVLRQRLYATPGRQYAYLNAVAGDKKKPTDIKYELGRAAQYTIKEGWPVIGAGAGWWLANNWYKKQIAKGLAKRLAGSFTKRWWQYAISPFTAPAAIGKAAAGEGVLRLFGLVRTPILYAIGAYAAYKTIGYFLKRRREKRLENEEVERLENMRNEFLQQRQDFNLPEQNRMLRAA